MESQSHPKWVMDSGAMDNPIVNVLNIGETLVPGTHMLRVVHAQDLHNHSIDDLCFVVSLGVESSGFSGLGVQQ